MSTLAFQPQEATVGADDFAALEQRILRTVDLFKAERSARAAAEAKVAELHQSLEEQPVQKSFASAPKSRPCAASANWCAPASSACFASWTSFPPKQFMSDTSETNRPSSNSVTVEIFEQSYRLRGEDPEYIHQLAAVVDAKMRLVASQGKTVDSLRVAVLAALNLADELARAEEQLRQLTGSLTETRSTIHDRASSLNGLLDSLLAEDRRTG